MTSASRNPATVDEIVATLKKTSIPTIIVEGKEDMIVYRRIEDRLSHLEVDFLAVGGRDKVLDIFARRSEIPKSVKVAFVADQDVWVMKEEIPDLFRDPLLIFTSGYSIENDMYVDGALWELLYGNECDEYSQEREAFIEWYALALSRHIVDMNHTISLHPDHVLKQAQRPALLALLPNETYPTALQERISNDYQRLLRGKSLLKLLVRQLSHKDRDPRHSTRSLLDHAAVRFGPNLRAIMERIEMLFPSVPL